MSYQRSWSISSLISLALVGGLLLAGCDRSGVSDTGKSVRIIHNDGEFAEVFNKVKNLTLAPLSKVANGDPINGEDIHSLEEAEPLVRGLVAYSPRHFPSQVVLAQTLYALGNVDESYQEYAKAVDGAELGQKPEIEFLVAECYSQMAAIKFTQYDYEKALEHINEALLRSPDNVKYLVNKGSILVQLNRNDDARSALNQALSLDPKNEAAKDLLGLIDPPKKDSKASS